MGNLDFSANADQLKELAAYMASQINVPTIGIGGGYAPIGTIISIMGTTAPQDYLACDGTVYSIADYPQLADYFESQFGTKNHFGGNGTTTFAVPDLQGEFLRGTGNNSHANQGSGANVGEHQDGTILPRVATKSDGAVVYSDGNSWGEIANPDYNINGTKYFGINSASSTMANSQIKATTRPTNTSVLYCIKAVVAGEVYSTEERVVGTWIDGKKLYQKTIQTTTPSTATNWETNWYDVRSLNIDRFVNGYGFLLSDSGFTCIIPSIWTTVGTVSLFDFAYNDGYLHCSVSGWTNLSAIIHLLYTKTTD